MFRRRGRAMVRRGPGVLGAIAGTAVVASTAAVTANAVNSRAQAKAAQQQEVQAAQLRHLPREG